jgi:hypothetical protein
MSIRFIYLDGYSSLLPCFCLQVVSAGKKSTFLIHYNEFLAEVEAAEDDDSLTKEAHMSIFTDTDALHIYAASTT